MGLSAGTRLGPYEIQSALGAGGMGEVYRALDTRLDRTVAIKVLNSFIAPSPELKQRFEREARIISRLNHPHICTLHDIGNQDGTDFLVMEYLEGETLAQRLTRGALGIPDLLKIAIDILDGLEQAHRAGVVHRDLKPGNVMLTKTGAKLLDFGLAKPSVAAASASGTSAPMFSAANTISAPSPQSPLTTSGALLGTVQYMAPEQLEGKEADARTDIFAFGSMLYEMATGKRPFPGKTQIKIVSAILEDDPQPASQVRPGLSPSIEHVVRTCLEKNSENRYHSAHDVAVELKWVSESGNAPPTQLQAFSKLWIAALILASALLSGVAVHFFPEPLRLNQLWLRSYLRRGSASISVACMARRRFLPTGSTLHLWAPTAAALASCCCARWTTQRLHPCQERMALPIRFGRRTADRSVSSQAAL